jgi:N-acetylglutamate synthase-like GNAT family acetyltransferase
MNIRALTEGDMEEITKLHDKYFSTDFEMPDFSHGYIGAFVITNDDGKIVMAGGVRPIAETILVTDKEANPHLLGDALLEALRYSLFTCTRYKIDELFAFVKDPNYEKHLRKYGFTGREGIALKWELDNGKKQRTEEK